MHRRVLGVLVVAALTAALVVVVEGRSHRPVAHGCLGASGESFRVADGANRCQLSERPVAYTPAAIGVYPGAGVYTPLPPVRILDTRIGTGGINTPIDPGQTITVAVAGQDSIPATGVGAVALNIAVTQPTNQSFLTVYPTPVTLPPSPPLASSVNFAPNQSIANLVIAKLGEDGKVNIYNHAGSAHLVADVAGWFSDSVELLEGADGNTILNGSGAPDNSLGADGDFYIDTAANKIYGPKAAGAWPPTGVSLVGPAGSGPMLLGAGDGSVTTLLSGASGTVMLLPLSAGGQSISGVVPVGGNIDLTQGSPGTPVVSSTLPRAVTATGLAATGVTTVGQDFASTVVTITVRLYTAPPGTNVASPSPALSCVLVPPLTGVVVAGTTSTCVTTGAAVPLAAGTQVVLVVSATATGPFLISSAPLKVSAGLSFA